MDVFGLRDSLIADYARYITSFIEIRDRHIQELVETKLMEEGHLWPEALIQLNPGFESGGYIDQLVDEGLLHPECRKIFRSHKSPGSNGDRLRLHKHQTESIRIASAGHSYILTTGTGSGKSLAYIIPIVDRVLRSGTGKGIRAIIVYPMNALANSQRLELEKFLCIGYSENRPPVSFARYTGQEKEEERERILAHPPDILLTNYVMLELLLTRPYEHALIQAASGLSFLVLDELHTYRGRQGADVALLIRRTKDQLNANSVQCVGTSATLAGPGTYEQQQIEVARVASQLFGQVIEPEHVVGESLRRIAAGQDFSAPGTILALKESIDQSGSQSHTNFESFTSDPLTGWIEETFGLATETGTGRLLRSRPVSIGGAHGASERLSKFTEKPVDVCAAAIKDHLLAGYRYEDPETHFPAFAFRLHQFISRGDTVYASLESEGDRFITVSGQHFVPGDRSRVLLPLVFCRECGQEYYCVRRKLNTEEGTSQYDSRELGDRYEDDESEAGFIYASSESPWPQEESDILQRIPEDWTEESKGVRRVRRDRRDDLPRLVRVGLDASLSKDGLPCHYIPSPFRFCLHCGVSYDYHQRSDFGKLSSLGSEGRSTATTILSLSLIRHLRSTDLAKEAQKLLSFTDNRQDASLQAGHFNDFIEIGLLRSALFNACNVAGESGLRFDQLTQAVFSALRLEFDTFASNPEAMFQDRTDTERALRDVLGYRLYRDLKRGWRVTSPNLEQCGLLEIQYLSLEEACQTESLWEHSHPALTTASPATRAAVARVLLDYMRRELAIKVDYLDSVAQERIQQQSRQHLIPPWALDEREDVDHMEHAAILFPRPRSKGQREYGGNVFLSARSGFGQFLRRASTFEVFDHQLNMDETESLVKDLLRILCRAGILEVVSESRKEDDVPGYQIKASALLWLAADGTRPFHDPIRMPNAPETGLRPNPFFVEYYKEISAKTLGMEAREHTAQVLVEDRIDRETRFREGDLPILYCSPTMELGVDIAELNAVNLRNIPPTPANYAQRSGRAGRSGQPALVFSYCSTGSPHDQYFFRRPELMVSGAVATPRIELANEDLIRAHIHAIWLKETGQSLYTSLSEILELSRGDGDPTLELLPTVRSSIDTPQAREKARARSRHVLSDIEDILKSSDWYSADWVDQVLSQAALSFDKACDRWRSLYLSALRQSDLQHRIMTDASRPQKDKKTAQRLHREAVAQQNLLTDSSSVMQSDFYSYRYFASEGFLPGYNFPRLPLSAYVPSRRRKKRGDEFLSRPRFLAISEFGPRAVVYHEGSRYLINRVIMPVQDEDALTTSAKQCEQCGYLHPCDGVGGADLCEYCGHQLPAALTNLFRLQNVATKRRDRISSDEEERLRMGYELKSGLRFAIYDHKVSQKIAIVSTTDKELFKLAYGHAATLWRINLGWARRKQQNQYGFILDTENGYWARNEQAVDDDPDPMSPQTARVIPFVEDRRNALLLTPSEPLSIGHMASLQAALKSAIQIVFQLEESELAAEPLPTRDDRRTILFYEAAEGGAGVLRHIVEDPSCLQKIAREALTLCHFDPDTQTNLRRAPVADEDCEAACYDCLMSYANQRDHDVLDRHLIKSLLIDLSKCSVEASPVEVSRSDHLALLQRLCDSQLEKKWLAHINERGLRLPTRAQHFIEEATARPDFLYDEQHAAVYINGPIHDFPDRQERDRKQFELMEDLGFTVVVFGHNDDWEKTIAKYPHVFGKIS